MSSRKVNFNGLKMSVKSDDRIIFANFDSSSLKVAAYDVDSNTLIVVHNANEDRRYIYSDFPAKEFFKMMEADSVGSFYAKNVKGKYEFYDEANK